MSPTTPVESSTKSAWVQLYEARRMAMEVEARAPGRPHGPVPRHKVGVTLSQGEIAELEVWQERFSALLHRKVSTGETVGLLARICSARFSGLTTRHTPQSLVELVEKMSGQE
jgi:hypothetical protein